MPKFTTHLDDEKLNIDTVGTYLQGYIQASLKEMVHAFGPQIDNHDSERVPMTWLLRFEDGHVATVYLWNQDPPAPDEVVSWNIGGKTLLAAGLVHDAFREKHGLAARTYVGATA